MKTNIEKTRASRMPADRPTLRTISSTSLPERDEHAIQSGLSNDGASSRRSKLSQRG